MALHPAEEDFWIGTSRLVRVYLDDIELLTTKLAAHGDVTMVVEFQERVRSRFDTVDDLIGRSNVTSIEIDLKDSQHYPLATVSIAKLNGIHAYIVGSRPGIRNTVEHFFLTLDRFPSSWRRYNDLDLVLSRRVSAHERREQRRHDVRIALWSGIVGALLGVLATFIAAILQS
jgi:hypothetical protein